MTDADGAPGVARVGNGDPDADPLPPDVDASDDEVEPVELLVQLAEDGEIEPWDIDIVDVTDAFLAKLDATDLRTSGRALFYASVLLRMKSDALLEADDDEEDKAEAEPWELAMQGGDAGAEAGAGFDPVDALEEEMDRRLERKHARGSPETLDELVRELREAERDSWWKRSRSYDTSGSPKGFDRGTQTLDYHAAGDLREGSEPTEDDVTGTTHDEDIEEVIETVRAALDEQYDAGRAEVLFAELRETGGTAVTTYLALLFLANRGDVRLRQDELFGDLWVADPAAASAGDEAVATLD
jgi:segregation and condensation protein A